MSRPHKDLIITFILSLIIIVLIVINISLAEPFTLSRPENIIYDPESKTLNFTSLNLEQKIGQMIITYGIDTNIEYLQNMFIGGVFMDTKPAIEDFVSSINEFQQGSIVPFFITTDLEGCRNPFENFEQFPPFSEIYTVEQANRLGVSSGRLLNELGFNMNFAPVVDLEDNIWGCRAFPGTPEEIAEKSRAYIEGLQSRGVMGVAKHYPGKTLVEDPHLYIAKSTIRDADLLPFYEAINSQVGGIMVSHIIATGKVNSNNMPSISSPEVITDLKNRFSGLVITDEVGMLGMVENYKINSTLIDYRQLFIDPFKAGNDLILTFDKNPAHLLNLIETVALAVRDGEIQEASIDGSVKKILTTKGIRIIY